jgi:hypothetical protein
MIAALALTAIMQAASGPVTVDPLELFAPEVSATASPTEVRLGQQITIVITATYNKNVQVNLPDPLFPAGAPLEIAKRDSTDHDQNDGKRVREWQIRAYAWELGEFDIPPIQVTFTAGGKAAVVPTNAIPLRVIGVLGDADDPKLMRKDAAPVPLWRRSWFLAWLLGGGVTVIAMAIYFMFFYGRRKAKIRHKGAPLGFTEAPIAHASEQESTDDKDDGDPHREVAPPPPPPVAPPKPTITTRARRKMDRFAEEALARLRALEASGRLDTDRRGAYRDMVAIIRDYLSARYDVDAQELTTRELCQALTFRSSEAAGLVRAWLEQCDVIKYAGLSASGDEARAVLDGACWLVDRTSPGAGPAASGEAARA